MNKNTSLVLVFFLSSNITEDRKLAFLRIKEKGLPIGKPF
ncbi:hypothetical protein IFVP22_C1200295 [Vibrio parahaemolyticus]